MADIEKQHIFFLDDESSVREAVRETLEELDIEVSCFASPAECLKKLRSQKCDLLITDLKMPEMNGIELMRDVKRLAPWVLVLVITGYGDIPTAVKAIKSGAVDFIEKPLAKESFLLKVKSILQKNAVTNTYKGRILTSIEKRVLKLVIDGKSNKEIANLLHRSKRTVEVHRAHIMRKLRADNLVDLVKRAVVMGLIDLESHKKPSQTTRNSIKRRK